MKLVVVTVYHRVLTTVTSHNQALEVAESQDRINLRTTYYNYAKHLESLGEVSSAIAAYEKSETHRLVNAVHLMVCYRVCLMLSFLFCEFAL